MEKEREGKEYMLHILFLFIFPFILFHFMFFFEKDFFLFPFAFFGSLLRGSCQWFSPFR